MKKPETKPEILPQRLTDRDKKVAVKSALAREINHLTVQAKELETALRPIKLKINYLRDELAKRDAATLAKKPAKAKAKPTPRKAKPQPAPKQEAVPVPEPKEKLTDVAAKISQASAQ